MPRKIHIPWEEREHIVNDFILTRKMTLKEIAEMLNVSRMDVHHAAVSYAMRHPETAEAIQRVWDENAATRRGRRKSYK